MQIMEPKSWDASVSLGWGRGSRGGGTTHRDPDDGGVRLDPALVALAHEAEGADGAGGNELDGQDGVNLADELVADLDGRFGDGAAKLR